MRKAIPCILVLAIFLIAPRLLANNTGLSKQVSTVISQNMTTTPLLRVGVIYTVYCSVEGGVYTPQGTFTYGGSVIARCSPDLIIIARSEDLNVSGKEYYTIGPRGVLRVNHF